MSDHKPEKKVKPPQAFGWMAEYDDENKFLEAARKVRDSGYTKTDAFAPFPVHGIDEALGIKPTILPWFSLIAGGLGTTTALVMQIWMNGVDYPYIISGKPFVSLPAFIPVTFELTVLFAAFTTVFAMLGLNGLPKFSNPVFTNPKFDRVTDDRFFLWVDSRDKYFNSEKVKSLLDGTHPIAVDEVREDATQTEVPKGIYITIATLILCTLVPLVLVWNMRAVRSGNSRLHVFFDMDFMPYKKAQKETTIFADGRTQRPQVPGTVSRGQPFAQDPYYLGYTPANLTASIDNNASQLVLLVSAQEEGKQENPPPSDAAQANQETAKAPEAAATPENKPAAPPTGDPKPAAADAPLHDFVKKLPEQVEVTEAFMQLGQRKYEQVCAACHGFAGYGDGLVSKRAEALQSSYWLQPANFHGEQIVKQPIGQVYFTIANGKGKMAGYSSTLNVQERWAVAFYVKALQRSQNAVQTELTSN
jgi:mono/diheme cytochrome c family protein